VEAILNAPRQPRDRVFLMAVYACGLRLAEARYLKTTDVDRARMQLRVRKGKGGKERVLPLSNRLLKELGDYWRAQRQGKWGQDIPWLFLGYRAEPICTTSGQNIFYRAVKKSGVRYKGGIHTLRHSFATHLIESGVADFTRCSSTAPHRSAGVWAQPTPRRSGNHRCLTYLGTKARLPSPSSLHCHRWSIKSRW
jgi:site-specific recombinase XerD